MTWVATTGKIIALQSQSQTYSTADDFQDDNPEKASLAKLVAGHRAYPSVGGRVTASAMASASTTAVRVSCVRAAIRCGPRMIARKPANCCRVSRSGSVMVSKGSSSCSVSPASAKRAMVS